MKITVKPLIVNIPDNRFLMTLLMVMVSTHHSFENHAQEFIL